MEREGRKHRDEHKHRRRDRKIIAIIYHPSRMVKALMRSNNLYNSYLCMPEVGSVLFNDSTQKSRYKKRTVPIQNMCELSPPYLHLV